MSFTAVTEVMLYCPKCQSTYPTGSRRFCDKDGVRLAAAPNPAHTPTKAHGGIFTTLLGRTAPTNQTDEKLASTPKFVPFAPKTKTETEQPKTTKNEEIFELELEDLAPLPAPKTEIKPEPKIEVKPELPVAPVVKPFTRIIKPSEIASGTAEIGDRRTNPTGRAALTWEKPDVLLGENVKGRYLVTEILGQDEESISYLAEDKIVAGKKVFVRVFMDEEDSPDFSNVIFAEERVSLSHINHPNIAKVIDSGELLEGKTFLVTEFIEGKTVKNMLSRTGQFNALRTGRIIRQASYALSEAHQNGILHRNLKPENIFLDVNEAGVEQVKLTGFGVLYDKITDENLAYKSPEQVEGALANYASDIYSLAVIAYQMLTNRLPFNVTSVSALKRAQHAGLTMFPTNLRLDIPELVDEILAKALSPDPAERYPKARDFGDAFFNALTTTSPWEKAEKADEKAEIKKYVVLTPIGIPQKADEEKTEEIILDELQEIDTEETFFNEEAAEAPAETDAEELPWEKRSPETVRESSPLWLMLGISALGCLVLAVIWFFILKAPTTPEFVPPVAGNQTTNIIENNPVMPTPQPNEEINEIPPPARPVTQPPNTIYFENSKQGLEGELAKNYLGFSLYYPNNWTKNASKTDFLDISKKSADGLPVKQIIITRYDSRGRFSQDKANFAKLVEKSNKDLKADLPDYKVVSEGETSIQNGRWKAYEVKFENSGILAKNGQLTLWGRRLWIPVQRPGIKSGFVITVVATSLSQNVKSVEDLVSDEELAQILETFEPALNN